MDFGDKSRCDADLFSGLESEGAYWARDEARAEAEAIEAQAGRQHMRERTLTDLTAELMQSGDPIVVQTPARVYAGQVVHVGVGLVTVLTRDGMYVDVDPARVSFWIGERARRGGVALDTAGAANLWARLLQLEIAGIPVEIETRSCSDLLAGSLVVVGRDHVILSVGGADVVVPIGEIVAVATSRAACTDARI